MKKLIVYGMGNRFEAKKKDGFWDWLCNTYQVQAIVDKNASDNYERIGTEKVTIYTDITNIYEKGVLVYITPIKWYDDIKQELVFECGVHLEDIVMKDELLTEYTRTHFTMHQLEGKGLEIGGPSDIFKAIYEKCYQCDGLNFSLTNIWQQQTGSDYFYGKLKLGRNIVNDVVEIKDIQDETYDFVISSNNLEHVANPLQAVSEMKRVLKKNGIMIILVPNKKYSFDHRREDTTFSHIYNDYVNRVREDDLQHLEEILENHDIIMDPGIQSFDEFAVRSKENFMNRCLHHHVFHRELLISIANFFEMEIIENTVLDINYMIIMRK